MNKKKIILFVIVIAIVLGVNIIVIKKFINRESQVNVNETEAKSFAEKASIKVKGIDITDLDLFFLKSNNNQKNLIYSPLSIKYGMSMLKDGTDGETKEQISNQFNITKLNRYLDNNNLSIANAFFIRDSFSKNIKSSYINTIKSEYNAEIIYDSFKSPDNINKWVSNKTFNLINNIMDDSISEKDFALLNTVAIDMEWVNKLQSVEDNYSVVYEHRNFEHYIDDLILSGYYPLPFKNITEPVESVEIGAVINKYDIINTLGEENIKNEVTKAYQKWLADGAPNSCMEDISKETPVNEYVENYMKEIKRGYQDVSSSTDFSFYEDKDTIVLAKDLKEYAGTTLQYIAIMPKKENLKEFINDIKPSDINSIINNLKDININNFEEGYITDIKGYIPMFKYDYELDLIKDLNKLGITNIFDINKADLSNMTTSKVAIDDVKHQANIDFSNDGIKASAAIELGGAGAGDCGFDYIYEVPVKTIDLSFNKPYIYLIREKLTGEMWFVGSVYEPTTYTEVENNGRD